MTTKNIFEQALSFMTQQRLNEPTIKVEFQVEAHNINKEQSLIFIRYKNGHLEFINPQNSDRLKYSPESLYPENYDTTTPDGYIQLYEIRSLRIFWPSDFTFKKEDPNSWENFLSSANEAINKT